MFVVELFLCSGELDLPHLIHPLTVELLKPRLCYDARFLNLLITDNPFSLDKLSDLPRYVERDSYQTVLDDKSGYDHILLSQDSLPFGWKAKCLSYHRIGASNFFRSLHVPCSLYIDDRHNGELLVPLNQGRYAAITETDQRHLAAAKSALFLVIYSLIHLRYFLNLSKSILVPHKIVPYLGFLVNSSEELFQIIPHKKEKFLSLLTDVLKRRSVTMKMLQELVGKCVSFPLAIPAALLFTREMNAAISLAQSTGKLTFICGSLREEISVWLEVSTWSRPFPWREERHLCVTLAADASSFAWGGRITSPIASSVSYYWSETRSHEQFLM